MVNMKDVARAAGVSQAAVSYAYSHPAKLSENQVRHIMKTADRLGYAGPNIIGSSLRSGGRTGAIGVMVMDTLHYAFTDASTKCLPARRNSPKPPSGDPGAYPHPPSPRGRGP